MTERTAIDLEADTPKRFGVELMIVHPTLDPAEIAAALGLEAEFSHRVGDRRKTPKGTSLPGTYRDTRWRHCRDYETPDQWFAEKVAELVDCLEPYKSFLRSLRSSGGSACVIVQFLGDGYFGDEIPCDLLTRLGELALDFGIECYTVPQSSRRRRRYSPPRSRASEI